MLTQIDNLKPQDPPTIYTLHGSSASEEWKIYTKDFNSVEGRLWQYLAFVESTEEELLAYFRENPRVNYNWSPPMHRNGAI